jgi:hypothetical protein
MTAWWKARGGLACVIEHVAIETGEGICRPPWQQLAAANRIQPVVAISDGIPVSGFGSADILSLSPDLAPGELVQESNNTPSRKMQLKKSWEIKNNKIGATPPRTPRSWMMDFKPLRAAHLIDGNPATYWSSRGQTRPDVEPEWIRIDLTREAMVGTIVLVPRHDNHGWPGEITIRVSTDAWHWKTVYENHRYDPPAQAEPQSFSFEPTAVKQVWIIANQLRWAIAENFLVFSLAGVEVHDEQGANLALFVRGAGVTVSSTNHGSAGEKPTHDMLWPVHYDLGLSWMRISYWDSVFNWHYAEQERDRIVIDQVADDAITETAHSGINIVLCLAYGNWLYSKEAAQKQNIEPLPPYSTATKQIWVVPFEWPPPPTDSDEHLQAWLRFVRAMVRHFKGRIHYYEIWNEQNGNWNSYYRKASNTDDAIKSYCRLAKETAQIIRKADPDAKIMLGSVGRFDRAYMTSCLQQGMGPLVDVIPWHPFYGTRLDSPEYRSYRSDVVAFKKVCEQWGFKGEYMATESGWYAPYPVPDKPFGGGTVSEIVKAKCLARYITMSVGLGLTTFWNTTWHHYTWWDLGLFRNSFSADPVSPLQPQAAYFVLRNLCTLLDSAAPASASVIFSNYEESFEVDTFRLPSGALLAGLSLRTEPADSSPVVVTNVRFPAESFQKATCINILNGTEQSLRVSAGEVQGLMLRDYPCFVRLEKE